MSHPELPMRTKKRQHCPLEERRRLVELTFEQGASLSKIASAHDVHPSSLSHWRSLYRAGKLAAGLSKKKPSAINKSMSFLPVRIASAETIHTGSPPPVARSRAGIHERTILHITAPSGVTLRIETTPCNVDLFAAVLAEIRA